MTATQCSGEPWTLAAIGHGVPTNHHVRVRCREGDHRAATRCMLHASVTPPDNTRHGCHLAAPCLLPSPCHALHSSVAPAAAMASAAAGSCSWKALSAHTHSQAHTAVWACSCVRQQQQTGAPGTSAAGVVVAHQHTEAAGGHVSGNAGGSTLHTR
jgi:hypothetical protein